ncbi:MULTISPECIES: LysE family transporter [Micromonospora]|uniref:Lysine transporter LysE n=1 Tax=Micromonospora solifontis TaxID=2487138 RepID=A0ABX9WH72_9ACTN|nr:MULTISPECIES: LysE family transporter [Micromonospora]NES16659.1 LysE family transporter [Micromonospora sp. PPF5-17B]NES37327.1 LysE family transporter [Micromonospora solifontis]NES56785.1 LysE family transporter [Micromonospora sp. PPF5-6]RNL98480.1 lysine transporter LysE [Micromonospora solifontis]
MSGAFLAGVVAGYGVAVPVGAIAILILGLSARTSFRVGAAAALAVATADGLYAAVAAFGGAGLAGFIAPVAGPLRVVAALVLLGLAGHGLWRAWSARRSGVTPEAPTGRGLSTPGRAYAAVLGLTMLNPTTVLYFAALVLGRQEAADLDGATAGLFVAGAFLASASWQLLVAGGGSVVGRALAGPRGRLLTGLLSSALIAALAVAALLSG